VYSEIIRALVAKKSQPRIHK